MSNTVTFNGQAGFINQNGQFVPYKNQQGFNGGNNRQNNNNNNNNNQMQYKSSGATYTKISEGMKAGFFHVSAWRKTKQGLMTASCFPALDYSKDGKPEGVTVHKGEKRGNEFVRYVVTVVMGAQVTKFYTLMSLETKKINLPELGLVISPEGSGTTRSGKKVKGYFGRNHK